MLSSFEIAFQWRGFELHPEIPLGGVDISAVLPQPTVDAMNARLTKMADTLGVPYTPRAHAPNTKRALALSAFAADQGRLDPWRTAAMNAHWRDGRDLEDPEVLRALATEAGLDPDAALAFLDDPRVPTLLQAQRDDAARWGVTGIPTWFMLPAGWTPEQGMPESGPRPVRVVGCQPAEVVARAAEMAGATPR